jgi:hypothetical protein
MILSSKGDVSYCHINLERFWNVCAFLKFNLYYNLVIILYQYFWIYMYSYCIAQNVITGTPAVNKAGFMSQYFMFIANKCIDFSNKRMIKWTKNQLFAVVW